MVIRTNAPTIDFLSITSTEDGLLSAPDLVCFSPLRWEMLGQKSQKILSNYAQQRRIFFIEEPVVEFIDSWWIDVNQKELGVWVVVPHVLDWVSDGLRQAMCQSLMKELFERFAIATPTLWHSTPAVPSCTHHLKFSAVVYNGMNELLTAPSTLPST